MSNRNRENIGGSYFVATISVTLVLLFLGIIIYIGLNSREIANHVKKNIGFTLILREDINSAEISKLQNEIKKEDFVASLRYVTKEEAAAIFKKEVGEDFEAVLGYNPLLPSIEIHIEPSYANNASLAKIEKGMEKYPEIKEVSYRKSFVELVNKNINRISMFLLVTGALMAFISFTLIRNTIHLSVYSQRFLIKTMQLVGAKSSFICRPFIKRGITFGYVAGIFASSILFVGVYMLQREVGGILDLMRYDILGLTIGLIILCGIFLSGIFSWFSVISYTKKDIDRLYK